ncbi:MAG: ATP-binding protein [Lachnospiraceae bacterium]|nr:ATP-binding protein [Lachnospiraceae bacterium]
MSEITLDATVENLDEVLSFVGDHLDGVLCPPKIRMQIDLAVEELFVNIAHYAYRPETGSATIRVERKESPLRIEVTFMDRGVPYDPLKKADPDVSLSAAERQIGGLGIYMVKQSMDDVRYEYRDGQNILTIVKNLDTGSGGGGPKKTDQPKEETPEKNRAFPLFFAFVQWTWGLLQTFAGALLSVFLLLKDPKRQRVFFHGAVALDWNLKGSMSLGMFLFLSSFLKDDRERVLVHEYGHSLQSMILGPAYLPVIGLPSLLWTNLKSQQKKRRERQIPVTSFYTEKWAGHAAEKKLGMAAFWG